MRENCCDSTASVVCGDCPRRQKAHNVTDELANWVLRINKLCNEKDARIERLSTALQDALSVMGEAQSCFIAGSAPDLEWDARKEDAVKITSALLYPDIRQHEAAAPVLLTLLVRWRAEARTADNELCELTDAAIAKATGRNQ